MLVEFSVENYRSIKEKQTLSMVASTEETLLASNSFPMPNSKKIRLLTSTAIYGPNASGKSNLVQAIQTFQRIVLNSASRMQVGDRFPVQPFLFDTAYEQKPTGFEVIFIQDNIRYAYGISLDQKRVYEEWLLAYPKGRAKTCFSRRYNPENPDLEPENHGYEWSFPSLKGEKKRIQQLVRPNSLFLSHAAQNNHPELTEIFSWFLADLKIINCENIFLRVYTAQLCQTNPQLKNFILTILRQADFDIYDIAVKTEALPNHQQNLLDAIPLFLSKKVFQQESNEPVVEELYQLFKLYQTEKFFLMHKLENAENDFRELQLEQESEGTQRLFEIAGFVLEVLIEGKIIIIDELDRSMHPILARELVRMFNNPEINKNHAQLIFTTHDTTLLDREIFRADQIGFTEKNHSQTKLYSLLEFRPREDESLQRGYLLGRYGAIPFISGLSID